MNSVKENLIAALRYILVPLCRIAVRNGITSGDLTKAINDALVRASAAELKSAGIEDASDEEVAQISGLTIEQIRTSKTTEVSGTGVKNFSFSAQEVLAGWNADRDYAGPYGLLLDIPLRAGSPGLGIRSFETLVAKYAGPNVSARVVLEELLKTGNVVEVGDGVLRCSARSYRPLRLSPENIQRFATVVHNLIGTLAVNLQTEVHGTGLYEQIVWADFGVNADDLQKFNTFFRARAQSFADEIDTRLSEYSNKDRQGPIRTGIGLYHYVENDEDREAYLKSFNLKGDSDVK
jgi:hypothetical protein